MSQRGSGGASSAKVKLTAGGLQRSEKVHPFLLAESQHSQQAALQALWQQLLTLDTRCQRLSWTFGSAAFDDFWLDPSALG